MTDDPIRTRALALAAELHAMLRDAPQDDWILPSEGARITKLGVKRLSQMANDRIIDYKTTPGGHRRYSRRQLEALANG